MSSAGQCALEGGQCVHGGVCLGGTEDFAWDATLTLPNGDVVCRHAAWSNAMSYYAIMAMQSCHALPWQCYAIASDLLPLCHALQVRGSHSNSDVTTDSACRAKCAAQPLCGAYSWKISYGDCQLVGINLVSGVLLQSIYEGFEGAYQWRICAMVVGLAEG